MAMNSLLITIFNNYVFEDKTQFQFMLVAMPQTPKQLFKFNTSTIKWY